MRRCIALISALVLVTPIAAQEHGVKVPPGFKVTLYADHTLANDIYCMTLDDEGKVLVSGRGWVKTLFDTDKDGKADTVTTWNVTKTGAMGLGTDRDGFLYLTADGQFSFVDLHTQPKAVQTIIPIAFSEHGGHAMRKGPDGCWYLIYGNSSNIENAKLDPTSPIKKPEAGGILRFSRDLKKVECIAQGFRNPYDFDFTPLGDIITYDSDTERDFLMPWYSPTRMYHVAHAQHHGWRLPGYMQSLARREYYADTVDILAPIGRGSPTGVTCYRHYQFPKRYRGGVFACDWAFGKIYFLPLEQDGTTYKTKPEVFLEPTGTEGFAPNDICVAPDGSLFVSIGGRGTRGAVYRIAYEGTKEKPAGKFEAKTDLDRVLAAPQPLDAWSRARWEPLFLRLLTQELWEAAWNTNRSWQEQIRAIEVILEKRPSELSRIQVDAMKSRDWQVRARLAWALGHDPSSINWKAQLYTLALDQHPQVRVAALDAIANRGGISTSLLTVRKDLVGVLASNLDQPDKRVRLAASRIVPQLAAKDWIGLQWAIEPSLRARLTFAIADQRDNHESDILPITRLGTALEGLKSDDPAVRLDSIRLLMLTDGDWCLHNAPDDVSSAYILQKPRRFNRDVDRRIREQLRQIYPSGDRKFDLETARYFTMIEDDDPATAAKVLSQITAESDPTDDVHHLIVLSRLKGEQSPKLMERTIDGLFGLEKKLGGQQSRIKQNWGPRMAEVVFNLMLRQPRVAETMLKHHNFVQPSHLVMLRSLTTTSKIAAARLFLPAVQKDANYPWSPELVDLLAHLPRDAHKPLFRKQWDDHSLRDAILLYMLDAAEERDRHMFLDGLESSNHEIVIGCIRAIHGLTRDDRPRSLVPIIRRLRQAMNDPKEIEIRRELLALVRKHARPFHATAEATVEWFETTYPAEAKLLHGEEEDPAAWKKVFDAVEWSNGDAEKGLKLFQQRSCAVCHTGSSRIGPDLAGLANRFSRDDLFTAIVSPSRDVAPAFRVNDIETKNGLNYSGIVVFESADGVIVQQDAVKTVRIDNANIATRRPGRKSLMPSGLLKDLKPADLADLYAYLRSPK